MKIVNNAIKGVKKALRKFLEIYPAQDSSVVLREGISYQNDITRSIVWYRGDAYEIEQFFKAVSNDGLARFWSSSPPGEKIRKAHSGLPSIMIDTLANVVIADMQIATIEDELSMSAWEEISKENDWENLIKSATVDMMVTGDGAFKINIDTSVSPFPLIEFYDASRVDYERKNGKITAIIFYTPYILGDNTLVLQERYSKGSVSYSLWEDDKKVPLERVPQLKDLQSVTFDNDFIMAVPVFFRKSKKYPGRGRGLFDGKTDVFDIHDEIISQWLDAIRDGRVQKYIPDDMIAFDEKTGKRLEPDRFGASYVQVSVPNMEGQSKKIESLQPDINYEAFVSSYSCSLNQCLQGIMSPATLGIDVSKLSSGEAQREKKDITGMSRNSITAVLEKALPQLIKIALKVNANINKDIFVDCDVSVSFGEYASPDFDSRISALAKASQSGLISTEALVEELWADSKEEDWKAQEVKRIKTEKGIDVVEEPSLNDFE